MPKSKSKSKSHDDWRSVSPSVRLGVEPHLGLMTRYLLVWQLRSSFMWGALSDERMGLSFVYATGPCQRSLSQVWVPLVLATIFYCLRFGTSLFVASYDSQGHGGGIRPRLHTGVFSLTVCQWLLASRYIDLGRTSRKTRRCPAMYICEPHRKHRFLYRCIYSAVTPLTHGASSSWEAENCGATQELPSILRNPKIYYRVHKRLPLVPILSQIDLVHTIPSYLS
jgi:hypothetical protein